jgi:hypothetical protein
MGRLIPKMIVRETERACRKQPGRPLILSVSAPDDWVLTGPWETTPRGATQVASVVYTAMPGGSFEEGGVVWEGL